MLGSRSQRGTSLECERFRGITWSFVCSASWKAGELCVIESAVTAFFSDLLFVCVVNLYKRYCFCYLCFVFPGIFVNRPSCSIILLVGLFSTYTHRTICVTLVFAVVRLDC
ncbi:hypothetical protein AVEN_87390-1 [Araneus ventricosus]|uniref:Uncharacterized protein n=1 Tax=Araneus ventricosus TaxID=182803 RepID=A0A4Y2IDQ4_ARAVE|nr:hypothetical protein AVEN_87390-1 [Araneus ventricosus]